MSKLFLIHVDNYVFRYKFDDERVTKEDVKRALEEQYGGEEEVISFYFYSNSYIYHYYYIQKIYHHFLRELHVLMCFLLCSQLPQTNPGFNNTPFKFTKYSNAYMLVYIRESDKDKIICNVDEKDIAEHLRVNALFSCSLFLINCKYISVQAIYRVRLTFKQFQVRLKKEQEEKEDKKRYKAQAHLFTIIKV